MQPGRLQLRSDSGGLAIAASVGVLAVALFVGSGCDSAEAAPQCPDVAGSWEVVEHCTETVIGDEYPVTQDGCHVTADTGVFVTEIEIALDGTFEADILLLGTVPITCTGVGDTEQLTMSCPDVNCEVRMVRVD